MDDPDPGIDDIGQTIALWRAQWPRLTAFEVWKALGHAPFAAVTWDDVREFMARSVLRRAVPRGTQQEGTVRLSDHVRSKRHSVRMHRREVRRAAEDRARTSAIRHVLNIRKWGGITPVKLFAAARELNIPDAIARRLARFPKPDPWLENRPGLGLFLHMASQDRAR